MKHTPFAALPLSERQAVVDAVRGSRMAMRDFCVSTLELPAAGEDDGVCCLATVSTRGWNATYDARGRWVDQLKLDLQRLMPGPPPAPAPAATSGDCGTAGASASS
jgi:hypothetical protein